MSGAQIVFGIARRVPLSEYFKILFGRNERVRIYNTNTTHTAVESIIFHESHLLTTFRKITSRLPGHYFEPFSSAVPRFEMRFPLARLVKAEIVSPFRGILINTGVGNPTVPFAQPLGIGEF